MEEIMKEKISIILNNIRDRYFLMRTGKIQADYEELLFQMDEEIRKVLEEEKK